MNLLGIDIGGTKIEVTLFRRESGFELTTLGSLRSPTDRTKGYPHILETLEKLIREISAKVNSSLDRIHGIGIGLPGSVDPQTSIMIEGNTSILKGKNLGKDLVDQIGFTGPVLMENDANCFALAEALSGVGLVYAKRSSKPVTEHCSMGIILGTGVGGGIVVRGRLWQGCHGGAGEVGHMELVAGGHPCYCKREGCAEQYLSGPALEAMMATRSYSQIKTPLTSQEVFALAKKQDPVAMAVVHHYKRFLAKFIANLINAFDPDYFVFGGGMSNQGDIYIGMEEMIREQLFLKNIQPVLYQHTLGDSAGARGAALLHLV